MVEITKKFEIGDIVNLNHFEKEFEKKWNGSEVIKLRTHSTRRNEKVMIVRNKTMRESEFYYNDLILVKNIEPNYEIW